jgi:Ran GTPase-activating protein 1
MATTKVYSVLGEKREMVDKKRAEELVALAKGQVDFEEIQLSSKSFGLDSATVMGDLLNKFTKLQRAHLNDCIAGRPEEEALKVLSIFCTALKSTPVTEIDLSDNALGKKGILACKALLEEKENLEKLWVNNVGLAPEAAEALAELLLFRQPTKLRLLHCFNNLLVDRGAAAFKKILAQSPLLEDVRFSATRFTKLGGLSVADGLLQSGSTSLRRMDLSDNSFGGSASTVLQQLLVKQPNLEFLSLGDTSMDDQDLIHISAGLSSDTSTKKLHTLILSGNELTRKGIKHLVKVLKAQKQLRVLRLEENELKNRGAQLIAEALKDHSALEELNLASNSISQKGGLAVINALKHNKVLKTLNLNGNKFRHPDLLKKQFERESVLSNLSDNEEDEEEEEEEDEEVEEKGGEDLKNTAEQLKELKV